MNGIVNTNKQSKAWVFTLNNPTEEETQFLSSLSDDEKRIEHGIQYVIYGEEVGESGTRHYQGYIEFLKRIRLTGCRKIFPRAHWETRRGTPLQGIFRIAL